MAVEEEFQSDDQRLADKLAAYDEALKAGEGIDPTVEELDEVDRRRLDQALSLLRLVDQARPHVPEDPPETEPEHEAAKPTNRLGRFEIVRELGRGGFGVVFLAIDPILGRKVALKVPRPEVLAAPEGRRRSLREAQAAAGLDHLNVVRVYEAGQIGPVCYIASAYYEGSTLAAWLGARDRLVPDRQAARLTASLADAVQHAHDRGVLHRDLKPANVLLEPTSDDSPDGFAFIPRVTDFGLAKLVDHPEDDTLSGLPIGSPPYMAPEQAAGRSREAGPWTDVYALGAILYELLSGRPPHRGETPLETIRQVLTEEPDALRHLRPELPRDLERIVGKCLEKEPRQRYERAGELADDLRRFLDGAPVHARPAGALSHARSWALNPRRIQDAGMLAMIFAGLIGAWCFLGVILASLGVGLHPPRPAAYIASCFLVLFMDIAPTFFLGWKAWRGRIWALWGGAVYNLLRVVFQASFLFETPSSFGGLYQDPSLRVVVFAFILLTTASIFMIHLVAIVGWFARRELKPVVGP